MTTANENRVSELNPAKLGERIEVSHGRGGKSRCCSGGDAVVIAATAETFTMCCECGDQFQVMQSNGYRRATPKTLQINPKAAPSCQQWDAHKFRNVNVPGLKGACPCGVAGLGSSGCVVALYVA